MKPFLTTYRGIAHTWMCDHNHHLNTRFYMAMFDDSMQHFFSILGYRKLEDHGWADVKHEIAYSAEVLPGSLVQVDCAIIRLGGKSITYEQRLILSDSADLAATNVATTVLFDQNARKAVEVPKIIRENAEPYTLSS